MSAPSNVFDSLEQLSQVSDVNMYLEVRNDYNGDGLLLYTATTPVQRASVDANVWFIRKVEYDVNGNILYMQLPVNGPGYKYSYSARASYFL